MFIIRETKSNAVSVHLETSKYNSKIQLVGYDNNGKRRVIITLHEDGTFSRNPFANLLGVKTEGNVQQIREVNS